MKYRFDPSGYLGVVVDAEKNTATFDNGHTVDVVGGLFAYREDTRFEFQPPDPENGRRYAVLSAFEPKVVAIARGNPT